MKLLHAHYPLANQMSGGWANELGAGCPCSIHQPSLPRDWVKVQSDPEIFTNRPNRRFFKFDSGHLDAEALSSPQIFDMEIDPDLTVAG